MDRTGLTVNREGHDLVKSGEKGDRKGCGGAVWW